MSEKKRNKERKKDRKKEKKKKSAGHLKLKLQGKLNN